jgi:hypothetical protein
VVNPRERGNRKTARRGTRHRRSTRTNLDEASDSVSGTTPPPGAGTSPRSTFDGCPANVSNTISITIPTEFSTFLTPAIPRDYIGLSGSDSCRSPTRASTRLRGCSSRWEKQISTYAGCAAGMTTSACPDTLSIAMSTKVSAVGGPMCCSRRETPCWTAPIFLSDLRPPE